MWFHWSSLYLEYQGNAFHADDAIPWNVAQKLYDPNNYSSRISRIWIPVAQIYHILKQIFQRELQKVENKSNHSMLLNNLVYGNNKCNYDLHNVMAWDFAVGSYVLSDIISYFTFKHASTYWLEKTNKLDTSK